MKNKETPALINKTGIMSLNASFEKIMDSPMKIKTNGVRVSFILFKRSTKILGISSIVNPNERTIVENINTRLMGSVKILFMMFFGKILFFLYLIPLLN